MTIVRDFDHALQMARESDPRSEVFPSAVAVAARNVLFTDGVSFSMSQEDLRIPLGASDDVTLVAENLQFTAGEGPCLTAIETGAVIAAPLDTMRWRWSIFTDLLVTRTDFRSVFAFPLTSRDEGGMAMNLFFNSADAASELNLVDVTSVSHLVAAALGPASPHAARSGTQSRWLDAPAAKARNLVWIAVGMVSADHGLSISDALARLRSHAYAEGDTVDEVAAWLVREPHRLDLLRA